MTQNRALQLLYDLRYLNIVLTAKGEEMKSGRSKPDSRYPPPQGPLFRICVAPSWEAARATLLLPMCRVCFKQ